MNNQQGTIDVERIMERTRQARKNVCNTWTQEQWDRWNYRSMKIRIDNALWCYRQVKSQEEKRQVVKLYQEEFRRLGWRIPKD